MTSSLPREVRDVFERFITTEYTTIDATRQPITWPVTPYYSPGGDCIDVTTGLGYPKKADDARRNPHVSLLFSDPTGSGIDDPPQVLVQGTAQVDDSDLEANRERYWRESSAKLPGALAHHPPRLVRGLFSWYYTRLYVMVRPERVFVWERGDVSRPPAVHDARLEEVRSGHSEEPAQPRPPTAGGDAAWDERLADLGERHSTAVLSWLAPDGFPLSVRLPVRAEAAARRIALGAEPAGLPLAAGRACLAAHAHAPDFSWQENFQVRGDLVRTESGWALEPRRLVGGIELPEGNPFALYARNLKRIARYYRTARRRRSPA